MAIKPVLKFPGLVDPISTEYPGGKAKDVSSQGSNDGTPLRASWVNDFWGLFQSLLNEAGVDPSNDPDQVGASQYLQSLKKMFVSGKFTTEDLVTFINATGVEDYLSDSCLMKTGYLDDSKVDGSGLDFVFYKSRPFPSNAVDLFKGTILNVGTSSQLVALNWDGNNACWGDATVPTGVRDGTIIKRIEDIEGSNTVSALPTTPENGALYYLDTINGYYPIGLYKYDTEGWNCLSFAPTMVALDFTGAMNLELVSGVTYYANVTAAVTALNITTTTQYGSVRIIMSNPSGYAVAEPIGVQKRGSNGLASLDSTGSVEVVVSRSGSDDYLWSVVRMMDSDESDFIGFVPLTAGTEGLEQTLEDVGTESYVYNIADFVGSDLDIDRIRSIHVECSVFSTDAYTATIKATFPGDTSPVRTLCASTGFNDDDDNAISSIVVIPVNPGQDSLEIELDVEVIHNYASFSIIGASQT